MAKKNLKLKPHFTTTSGRRRSSNELKYILPQLQGKYQKSETVTRLLPNPEQKSPTRLSFRRIFRVHQPEQVERDHHAAVDFYHKTAGLSPWTESFGNLRRALTRRSRKSHRKSNGDLVSATRAATIAIYGNRCRKCLHPKNDCFCDNFDHSRPAVSDWMKIISYGPSSKLKAVAPQHNRLEWLEKLEMESKINRKEYLQKKYQNREVCCFPFSTFNVFSKKDLEEIDFYTKK